MLQVAICDDNKGTRNELEALVRAQSDLCEIRQFGSAIKLLEDATNFDILLLDIGMKDMSGIEAAKRIKESYDPVIIFITALKEYVFDAFDVGAFHYLLKPIDENKLKEVFEKAVQEKLSEEVREPLVIRIGSTFHKVLIETIQYAENRGRKIVLHTSNGELEYYGRMGDLEQRLVGDFYRCHRGYLVNLKEIMSYDTVSIRLRSGDTIFLSKQKYHDFVAVYMNYLNR